MSRRRFVAQLAASGAGCALARGNGNRGMSLSSMRPSFQRRSAKPKPSEDLVSLVHFVTKPNDLPHLNYAKTNY